MLRLSGEGARVPLKQEAPAWHMTHHMAVRARGLQQIVKFIPKLERLVMCDGCKLLVETPGGLSGI